jgi:predicted branched-subunit amino acid permease
MINKEFFFKGFKSILAPDSPALALGCCFIAIGALLKNLGFNIQESIFSTMLTYALPGSLVMAESLLVGASLLNIFFFFYLNQDEVAVKIIIILDDFIIKLYQFLTTKK